MLGNGALDSLALASSTLAELALANVALANVTIAYSDFAEPMVGAGHDGSQGNGGVTRAAPRTLDFSSKNPLSF